MVDEANQSSRTLCVLVAHLVRPATHSGRCSPIQFAVYWFSVDPIFFPASHSSDIMRALCPYPTLEHEGQLFIAAVIVRRYIHRDL